MWKLSFFIIGSISYVLGGDQAVNITVQAGKNVSLHCLPNDTTGDLGIKLKRSDGSIFFSCSSITVDCEKNISVLTSTNLTIRNVSLIHEVPAKGLTLVEDNRYGKVIPKGGSIVVKEGGNKTLVCKTNTSVKPPVDLEWKILKGMNMLKDILQSSTFLNDSNDTRLTLPTLTIDFSPTYMDDDDGEIELVCIVKNSSQINASVIIKKKGAHEPTTVGNSPLTSLYYSHSNTANYGQSKGYAMNATSNTTLISTTEKTDWNPVHTVIIVGCLSFVLFIAGVCGIIGYRKRIVRRFEKAESAANAPESTPRRNRGSLPLTPVDNRTLPDRPLTTTGRHRPVPSLPPDIPTRPLVPVSEDVRGLGGGGGSQNRRDPDTGLDYDLLNHGFSWAVPHVYRETASGLAEYAQVSRQNIDKKEKDSRHPAKKRTEEEYDDSDYDLLNPSSLTVSSTVPHVYRESHTGLAEYAVVSKPGNEKKAQSLVSHAEIEKIHHDVEAEYAVVDKSKKRNHKRR
ncbi:uncharacterized protein LOC135154845 isoform X2 [Lytechinus pictus]|uniref:uncharacterized protein LOC135154845 isoform X2 n=1 Tax=Lytechinus pictus TaxID=7653 RepID=UPI0030B9DA41